MSLSRGRPPLCSRTVRGQLSLRKFTIRMLKHDPNWVRRLLCRSPAVAWPRQSKHGKQCRRKLWRCFPGRLWQITYGRSSRITDKRNAKVHLDEACELAVVSVGALSEPGKGALLFMKTEKYGSLKACDQNFAPAREARACSDISCSGQHIG